MKTKRSVPATPSAAKPLGKRVRRLSPEQFTDLLEEYQQGLEDAWLGEPWAVGKANPDGKQSSP